MGKVQFQTGKQDQKLLAERRFSTGPNVVLRRGCSSTYARNSCTCREAEEYGSILTIGCILFAK